MSKGQPRALELLRRRQDASRNPTKRETAAWNNFYASASPNEVAIPEIPAKRAYTPSTEPSEHQEQSAVIEWWFKACGTYGLPPIVLMSIPNAQILMGSARHPERVMQYLRKEGFRVGAPDLFLAVPYVGGIENRIHGLFIEMKRAKGGTQSVEQINFGVVLQEQGYRYELCHGAEAAIECIKEYMK